MEWLSRDHFEEVRYVLFWLLDDRIWLEQVLNVLGGVHYLWLHVKVCLHVRFVIHKLRVV